MFSDMPDFVCWETRRTVVGVSREEYERLRTEVPQPGHPDPGLDRDTWFHRPGPFAPGGTAKQVPVGG